MSEDEDEDYAPWPEDGQPALFHDLTEPLVAAVKFAYDLERKNRDRDIPWDGYNLDEHMLTGDFDPRWKLSAEMLRYDEDDQGREALEVIIGLAVQFGIVQGRRIERTSTTATLKKLRLKLAAEIITDIANAED